MKGCQTVVIVESHFMNSKFFFKVSYLHVHRGKLSVPHVRGQGKGNVPVSVQV